MTSAKVLIVEDDLRYCESLLDLLKKVAPEIRFIVCHNVIEAIRLAAEEYPDIIIADMRLPISGSAVDKVEDMDGGYEVLRRIKSQNPASLVIVHTAYENIEECVRCMRAGCFDYVPKMGNLERLLQSLREAVDLCQKGHAIDSGLVRESLTERLILSDWRELSRVRTKSKKGIALERLCSSLFSSIRGWERIDSRVRSKIEEIDLVIQNESVDEFWRRYGNFILIECKNWTRKSRPGRKEFDAFYAKIKRRGKRDCRLGLFVSFNGVTGTFLTEINRIAKEDIVVVALAKDQLWNMICATDRNQFLKDKLAKVIFS